MNKFILKGYIGNIESGKTYTKISIATTRSYKNDKGEYETDWFNAVAFGSTADFISKYFSKLFPHNSTVLIIKLYACRSMPPLPLHYSF